MKSTNKNKKNRYCILHRTAIYLNSSNIEVGRSRLDQNKQFQIQKFLRVGIRGYVEIKRLNQYKLS